MPETSEDPPRKIIRSQIIPPLPNPSKSSVDWLHDFGGFSWIAYGASSLLVISQFPSKSSGEQSFIGSLFRQVIEPCSRSSSPVTAVAWCQSRPPDGGIAAGLGERVFIYHLNLSHGPLQWEQKSVLMHPFSVQAVEWTKSGDGLVAAGDGVISWKRERSSWMVAWKLHLSVEQSLVSTTWSTRGPVATMENQLGNLKRFSSSEKPSHKVLVYLEECESQVVMLELCHPRPVSAIQWRQRSKRVSYSWRDVLLTCCLDGTVRLWSEIDYSLNKEYSVDDVDRKPRRSFHVISVIEMNHCLKGMDGHDLFAFWVTEDWVGIPKSNRMQPYFSLSCLPSDHAAVCDWLLCVGPDCSLSLFSVHCLDDLFPLRFPRIRLWRKFPSLTSQSENSSNQKNHTSDGESLILKSSIWRHSPSGAPVECSVLRLSAKYIFTWSHFYVPFLEKKEELILSSVKEEPILSDFSVKSLSEDSHVGRILQVAVHPYCCDMEVFVSLDSGGFLLFWSLSEVESVPGQDMVFDDLCHLIGKISTDDFSNGNEYLSLAWVPSVICGYRFLLLGGSKGIDCVGTNISGLKRKKNLFHKLFTISFPDLNIEYGPDYIMAIPLSSTYDLPCTLDTFVVVAVWNKEFKALAWKVVLQSDDGLPFTSSVTCPSTDSYISKPMGCKYESYFGDRRYFVAVDLCARLFSEGSNVTCFAVLSPDRSYSGGTCRAASSKHIHKDSSIYHIVTGHLDGIIRLWRATPLKSTEQISEETGFPWELVGMFDALCGPVLLVALSACGTKIAAASKDSSGETNVVSIWQFICLSGGGGFIQEGKVSIHGDIVALKWATLGNGHSVLAVCLSNKFCLYSPKRYLDSKSEKSDRWTDMKEWVAVAGSDTYSNAHDFAWGPGLRVILIHDKYISVFSQFFAGHHDHNNGHTEEMLVSSEEYPHVLIGLDESSVVKVLRSQNFAENGSLTSTEFHSISQLTDECFLSLPSFHPQALLGQLFSGNWRCAYGMVRHLTQCISSYSSISTRSKFSIPEPKFSEYCRLKDNVANRSDAIQWGHDNISSTSLRSEVMIFIDTLEKSTCLRKLMNFETNELLAAVDLLGEIVEPRNTSIFESFDHAGRRFWVSLQFQRFYSLRKKGKLGEQEDIQADSSMVAWAFLSESKDSFISSFLSADSSWKEMRNIGIGFWLTDTVKLRSMTEKLARLQYLKRKDPKDCALLYIALNRLQVLAGLFKISKDEKDKVTAGFLSRNFQEDRNKLAALKNAYVLMGKHQLELAIAFFLLGGDASSAVTVCAKNLGDAQLALLICRLIQGYSGLLEKQLVTNVLLPNAILMKDFWLASMLELSLGNWSNSFKRLLAFNADVENCELQVSSITFVDANSSEYLEVLSTKMSLRAAVGDYQSAVLSHWAKSMRIMAYVRSGFSLEALDSASASSYEDKGQLNARIDEKQNRLSGLNPFSDGSNNWVIKDVAECLDSEFKLNIAMQYISSLMMEHIWEENQEKMATSVSDVLFAMSKIADKYSMDPVDLMNLIFVYTNNHRFLSLGYHVLLHAASQKFLQDGELLNRLGKYMEEICHFLSRYVSLIGFRDMVKGFDCKLGNSKIRNSQPHDVSPRLRRIMTYLRGVRPLLHSAHRMSRILDFFDLFLCLSLAWVCKDIKLLTSLSVPLNGTASFSDLSQFLHQTSSLIFLSDDMNCDEKNHEAGLSECPSNVLPCLPSDDEQWLLIGVSLWRKFSAWFRKELHLLSLESKEDDSTSFSHPDLLILSLDYISSALKRYLRSLLSQKVELKKVVSTFDWIHDFKELRLNMPNQQIHEDDIKKSQMRMLWTIFVDPEEIKACFSDEEINFFNCDLMKQNAVWNDIMCGSMPDSSNEKDQRQNAPVSNRGNLFNSPHEKYKKNGELFEAICINSTDESEVALASNRKGLAFIRWKPTNFPKSQAENFWMDSDWPVGGWAGSESTPIPTFVSPGVGLGNRRGAQLGLGGATVGRDLTAFGSLGVPGYAGIGVSGLGWGEQLDFEDFKDPPATVDNIRTRALCSHPSKPLFLVGSTNTHVYLWEFGKEKATATYGVLPAANVPPPYALASISAVQFDICGHRFATVALDGTVCTWQLEVGGRSNVRPVDSSLCFNKHASAIGFITSSGSVIAAAGHSTNNANVVLWDTLAPPSASQTFLTCHEGGARSLSTFDNDIGFGQKCPLLITGGNSGNIALYDIRYITKEKSGMIWYEPSAHQGSVTKIVPIPSTSLILTGGKDGDVKLWDARRCEMLFHWKNMHERHTFIQPSSRGYGGITRAAVTDIQVVSSGFLSCGGDGSVKLVKLSDSMIRESDGLVSNLKL